MSEVELQSWSFTILDFRRSWATEETLRSGSPKEKESEMLVPRETERLAGDTGTFAVCSRLWRMELGPIGEYCRESISDLTERELSPS